jgi:hypothetical protein
MGAVGFDCVGFGNDVEDAFNNARAQAQYDYGHAGYTGTIAEKNSFVEFKCPDGIEPNYFVDVAMAAEYERPEREKLFELIGAISAQDLLNISYDKWGPCVAVRLDSKQWVFFGSASC